MGLGMCSENCSLASMNDQPFEWVRASSIDPGDIILIPAPDTGRLNQHRVGRVSVDRNVRLWDASAHPDGKPKFPVWSGPYHDRVRRVVLG